MSRAAVKEIQTVARTINVTEDVGEQELGGNRAARA